MATPTDLTLTLQLRLVQLVDVALDLGVEILAPAVQELAPAFTQHGQVVLLVAVMSKTKGLTFRWNETKTF